MKTPEPNALVLVCHPNGIWEQCTRKRWGEIVHEHIEEIMSGPPRRSAFIDLAAIRPIGRRLST